jgi:hypothetical protein
MTDVLLQYVHLSVRLLVLLNAELHPQKYKVMVDDDNVAIE